MAHIYHIFFTLPSVDGHLDYCDLDIAELFGVYFHFLSYLLRHDSERSCGLLGRRGTTLQFCLHSTKRQDRGTQAVSRGPTARAEQPQEHAAPESLAPPSCRGPARTHQHLVASNNTSALLPSRAAAALNPSSQVRDQEMPD